MSGPDGDVLAVFLHGERAGRLLRAPGGRLQFRYDASWVAASGEAISLHLPLREEPFDNEECEPFFSGLLPEGDFLRTVARAFHVSAGNPFSLLAAIGGECAGALALGKEGGEAPGSHAPPPRWLDDDELGALLDELPERPLALFDALDDEDGVRISLAGAHDKFGVIAADEGIGVTLGRPASTHILKLPIARVSEPVANEAYCLQLAATTGLLTATAEPRALGPHEFLLVRRYDRDSELPPDGRVHQEDFCQALGVRPEEKYEGEGARTSPPAPSSCDAPPARRSATSPASSTACCSTSRSAITTPTARTIRCCSTDPARSAWPRSTT